MFKIPIYVNHGVTSLLNFKEWHKLYENARSLCEECTMALDRTLKDLRKNNKTMGGFTELFSGDFLQALLVLVRSVDTGGRDRLLF